MKKFLLSFSSAVVISVIATSCTQTESRSDGAPSIDDENIVSIQSDSIVIAWDDPSEPSDSVIKYELYFKTPENNSWVLLQDDIAPSNNPQTVVYRSEIASNDSIFYFGTRSVAKSGKKSQIHSSNDASSLPKQWVLHWLQ